MPNLLQPVVAIVVAAGSGSRLGASLPKALVPLAGVALVRRACEALLAGGAERFVVTVPAGLEAEFHVALADLSAPVDLVVGGGRRQDSVRCAVEVLTPALEQAVVLVHDAARPLVPAPVVASVVEAVRQGARAVVPVVPVADSLRALTPDGGSAVVERDLVRAVQTPQGFWLDSLREAHRRIEEWGMDVTDDAAACEAIGLDVALVDGHPDARKVTTPLDLLVAEALLAERGAP